MGHCYSVTYKTLLSPQNFPCQILATNLLQYGDSGPDSRFNRANEENEIQSMSRYGPALPRIHEFAVICRTNDARRWPIRILGDDHNDFQTKLRHTMAMPECKGIPIREVYIISGGIGDMVLNYL